jgi:hypothetical protein
MGNFRSNLTVSKKYEYISDYVKSVKSLRGDMSEGYARYHARRIIELYKKGIPVSRSHDSLFMFLSKSNASVDLYEIVLYLFYTEQHHFTLEEIFKIIKMFPTPNPRELILIQEIIASGYARDNTIVNREIDGETLLYTVCALSRRHSLIDLLNDKNAKVVSSTGKDASDICYPFSDFEKQHTEKWDQLRRDMRNRRELQKNSNTIVPEII